MVAIRYFSWQCITFAVHEAVILGSLTMLAVLPMSHTLKFHRRFARGYEINRIDHSIEGAVAILDITGNRHEPVQIVQFYMEVVHEHDYCRI